MMVIILQNSEFLKKKNNTKFKTFSILKNWRLMALSDTLFTN